MGPMFDKSASCACIEGVSARVDCWLRFDFFGLVRNMRPRYAFLASYSNVRNVVLAADLDDFLMLTVRNIYEFKRNLLVSEYGARFFAVVTWTQIIQDYSGHGRR